MAAHSPLDITQDLHGAKPKSETLMDVIARKVKDGTIGKPAPPVSGGGGIFAVSMPSTRVIIAVIIVLILIVAYYYRDRLFRSSAFTIIRGPAASEQKSELDDLIDSIHRKQGITAAPNAKLKVAQ